MEVLWKTVISAGISGRYGEMTQIHEENQGKAEKEKFGAYGGCDFSFGNESKHFKKRKRDK